VARQGAVVERVILRVERHLHHRSLDHGAVTVAIRLIRLQGKGALISTQHVGDGSLAETQGGTGSSAGSGHWRALGTVYRHCRCRRVRVITTAVIGAVLFAIARPPRLAAAEAVDRLLFNGPLRSTASGILGLALTTRTISVFATGVEGSKNKRVG